MSKSKKEKIGADLDQIVKWYNEGVQYQKGIGLDRTVPECVKFYEGDQWKPATPKTKYFPRPVINIVEMICNNKKSQVASSPVKIVFKSESEQAAVEKFNRFAQYEQMRLRQDEINNKVVLDGVIKGSMCLYYYWDKDAVGLDGLVDGDIGVQIIDPLNVIFANPNEKDIQKQDWVMLISRENVENVKAITDKGVDKSKIADDSNDSMYNETESDTEKYVTVLTRFFRYNGEVYFERATKTVVFNKARAFTPNPEQYKKVISGEIEDTDNIEQEQRNSFMQVKKATLYPIAFGQWKQRDKSIYGRGEVETIIPNQKAINWTLGLQILMAQNEGMSPVVVKPDALRGQKITNEPGQVLTDYSKTGNGINFPNKPGMTQASVSLADKIADLTRAATGSSEVMSGEIISAGMSGAAIAQLQSQALKPIEDLQKNYWRVMEQVGEILEQFMRFFFNGKKFEYTEEDGENKRTVVDTFNSAEYKNVHFDVVAEAVAGTVMSDVADINMLDTLYAKGAISLKTYITCYPDNAIANRQKLLDNITNDENNQVAQLTAQVQQLQLQLKQATDVVMEQQKIVDSANSIITENRNLKQRLIALTVEYAQKIQQANAILVGAGKKNQELQADAAAMAQEIAAARGIKPGSYNEQVMNEVPDAVGAANNPGNPGVK